VGRPHLVRLGCDTGGEWVDTDSNGSHDDAADESTRFRLRFRFTDDAGKRRWVWGIDGKETVFEERIAGDANVAVDAEDDAEDG